MSRESFVAFDEGMRALAAGPPQYGTSMHYPSCRVHGCTGCLPPVLEGEIVEPWIGPDAWDQAAAAYAGPRVVLGFDVAAGSDAGAVVFAAVRDYITRVHVPDVPAGQ